jgi:proline iminopeptidase
MSWIDVPGGRAWYKIVGEEHDATPVLCLHGGPGFTPKCLQALEELADPRPTIFYDQLGSGRGRSSRPR